MASPTKQSETQRLNKTRKSGKKRKKALNNKGTTRTEKDLFGAAKK